MMLFLMQPMGETLYNMFLLLMFPPQSIPTIKDLYDTPPEDDKRLPISVSLTTRKKWHATVNVNLIM